MGLLTKPLCLIVIVLLNTALVFAQGQQLSAIKDSLHTVAGALKILEVQESCKYTVTLNGKVILRTDCDDESNKYYMTPTPTIHTYYKSISERIGNFDEVILFQMQMSGNACNGGDLIFLGLKMDKSYLLSNSIDFCGGRQPIITWGGNKVTVFIPGGSPNRGRGYIPPETWVYEKGFVRKIVSNNRRK